MLGEDRGDRCSRPTSSSVRLLIYLEIYEGYHEDGGADSLTIASLGPNHVIMSSALAFPC